MITTTHLTSSRQVSFDCSNFYLSQSTQTVPSYHGYH